jgi:hypothetical protein
MKMQEIYQIYSDESHSEKKRYTSICAVSGNKEELQELRNSLRNVLDNNELEELKFIGVKSHKPKIQAAYEFIDLAVKFAAFGKIRIDVLTYDLQDSRHNVLGRDDIKNIEIMYYKILRHCSEMWKKRNWEFYPDENFAYNWTGLKDYLNFTKIPRKRKQIAGLIRLFKEEKYYLNFTTVKQRKSEEEPIIQLADLFAGLAWFSIVYGEECLRHVEKEKIKDQGFLFDDLETDEKDLNKTKITRFCLINQFYERCKEYKLGVSLRERKYLWTPTPRNPINFWRYEPQSEYDKAPKRNNR